MAGVIKTEDTESEAGSISEEERIRKLFQACDGDGDGYIDSEDLLSICRELNLEQCVGELMQELGADEHGRISYQGFLRRRLELAGQVEAATRRLGRGTATETEEEETEEETEDEESRGVGRRRAGGGRTWGCGECGAHRGQEGEDDESCAREGRESSGDSGFRRALVVIDSATSTGRQQEYRQPTSSENSLGAGSGGRQERWEFDSGARDLSPEPQAPHPGSRNQQQVQGVATNLASTTQGALATPTQTPSVVNTNPPIPQGGTASLLDMANKLHQAALASLKSEIQDLTGQLKAVTQERDFLERSLSKAQLEKLRLVRDAEERLDSQAQRYEGRLTELHCVIAELSRKIRGHTSRIITEEEEEGDEDDSTTAAEEDDEDDEVDDIDDEEDEAEDEEDGAGSQSVAADTTQDDLSGVGGEEGVETETQDCCELESGRTELVDGEGTVVPDDATDHTQTQDLVVPDVRREEEEEEGLEQQRRLHRKVKELQGNLQQLQIITPSVVPPRSEITPLAAHSGADFRGRNPQDRSPCCPGLLAHDGPRRSPRRVSSMADRGGMVDRWVGTVGEAATSSTSHFPPSPQRSSPPQFLPPPPPPIRENFASQPKIAERVRIQRTGDGQHMVGDHGNITPSEMVDLGVCCNSRTAEHLVRDMREESSTQELRHATRCGYIGGSCSSAVSPNAQQQWKGEVGPSQSCITRLPMESSQISDGDREAPLQPSCGCLPVLRALELEVERQAGRAEAHRATAELAALSLEECRSACERQVLVLSRRGSDIVGLATALSFALPLCRACFTLSRVLEIRHSSGKAAKAKEEEEMKQQAIASFTGKPEQPKMKSRIPEFQNKNADHKGLDRSRTNKKGEASASGGSTGSGRSAEPEKSWLCRKREELGRSWGSKKDEGNKSGGGNNEQGSEEGKKGREAMFVDEGGYGKILGHGNKNTGAEEGQKAGKGGEGGSASSSSGGEESIAIRADVGCGGVDVSDMVRIIEAEAASLVDSLDCKMRLLNLAECRTEEMAEEFSGNGGGIPEEDWVLSWDDFSWIESLGKEEEGAPDMLRRLGRHISLLLKNLSSCGVGLKKAKDMAADASASENELGLPPSNIKPELYPLSQGQPGRKADLEVAVLMQELMAMREERAVLRTRIHALEGEREELGRVCMLLKLGRGEEITEAGAGGAIVPHIPSTKDLIRLVEESGKVAGSVEESSERLGEGRGAMVDNVSREQWLEKRLQELALTLEQVATSADVRLRQSTAVMNDLRRTNGTLAHSLERCRRRYQQRLKTLETQMENLMERHASQVRTLRQRISQLEERNEAAEAGGGCKVGQTGGRIGEVSL